METGKLSAQPNETRHRVTRKFKKGREHLDKKPKIIPTLKRLEKIQEEEHQSGLQLILKKRAISES